jgi:lipopolysaccharide export LptBFGC system permease protein LptF
MGYIEKHLLDGENVQYVTRLHWKIFIIPVAFVLFFTAPLLGFVAKTKDAAGFSIFIILMCIAIILVPYYRRKFSSEMSGISGRSLSSATPVRP